MKHCTGHKYIAQKRERHYNFNVDLAGNLVEEIDPAAMHMVAIPPPIYLLPLCLMRM